LYTSLVTASPALLITCFMAVGHSPIHCKLLVRQVPCACMLFVNPPVFFLCRFFFSTLLDLVFRNLLWRCPLFCPTPVRCCFLFVVLSCQTVAFCPSFLVFFTVRFLPLTGGTDESLSYFSTVMCFVPIRFMCPCLVFSPRASPLTLSSLPLLLVSP